MMAILVLIDLDIQCACADPEGQRDRVSRPPPWKITKNVGFLAVLVRIQASIQCWAIIGMPAKRHLDGVSQAGR